MQFNFSDRASFEAFGSHPPRLDVATASEAANLNEAEQVDVLGSTAISADEPAPPSFHFDEEPAAKAEAPDMQVIEPSIARDLKTGFSFASFAGGLASFAWIGGAIGVPLSTYGIDAILAMDPAMQTGLLALAFGPAVLLWVGASAAGEAMKARAIAQHLAQFAQDPHYPIAVGEARAQRLSETVKTEIESLNDAVATALHRLQELESAAQRNTNLFETAVVSSRETSAQMAADFAREREDLLALNADMRNQTETLSHSIGRQVRLMREASKLVKVEIEASEDVLTSHLSAFQASAETLAHNTAAFRDSADAAEHATSSLNHTMGAMLEGLGEATRLTDAARQSAAQASMAATETATVLKDHTQTAVIEVKRAAHFIRQETLAMQGAANETLTRLQAAADAARAASEESEAAADRHAAKIENRLNALAQTIKAKPAAPAPAPVARGPAQRPIEAFAAQVKAEAAVRTVVQPRPAAPVSACAATGQNGRRLLVRRFRRHAEARSGSDFESQCDRNHHRRRRRFRPRARRC